MTPLAKPPGLALCLEYPLALRGGVSVLVGALILGLSGEFAVWLVSPDDSAEVANDPAAAGIAGHLPFPRDADWARRTYSEQAKDLAERLAKAGVEIVHFHAGGTFGWGNCWPTSSIPEVCTRLGMSVLWTTHLTTYPGAVFVRPGRAKWLSNLLGWMARAGKIRQMRHVAVEIAVSDHDQAFLQREFRWAGRKVRRIYHSRLGDGKPPPAKKRLFRVLAVGHIAYRKGQDVLVQAFLGIASRFPDWELMLVGHDAGDGCWQEISQAIAAHPHGSRLVLLGDHRDPLALMTEASLFVQPSREEALGLAVQEAIFSGCPAVGTRVGGIPEVIDEGHTGLLVSPDDPTALGLALSRLMSDEALRDSMGSTGRAAIVAKGMTCSRMLEEHRQLYREILGSR